MSSPPSLHIADIDFPAFYASAFASADDSARFFSEVEALSLSDRQRVKPVLHQGARMLWLADRMDDVARGRPALQILFFLIAAEAVAKLVFNFNGEGESRRYVQRFFKEICGDTHRERLGRAFRLSDFLSYETAVDFLYDVRCDVVHTGVYFMTSLLHAPGSTPVVTRWTRKGRTVHPIANITATEIRQIVLEGALLGARILLTKGAGKK